MKDQTGPLQQLARWEPWLGAVVRLVDPPPAPGEGPLSGRTVGVKDLMAVAGMPMECGAPGVADPTPQPAHAAAVARLIEAGGLVVATLALHQWAFGIITPQTRNPRAPDRVAGGSSGGPAAALAAGLVDVALGSDTGGSIRIPASCCGVVGLKTSRGLVPLTGVQPLAWSLDTVGPMARTVADTRLVLDLIAGHDPTDPYSDSETGGVPLSGVGVAALRVGVPRQTEESRIDPQVRHCWEQTLGRLRASGATVTTVDLPLLAEASRANRLILGAEAAAIHGIRLADHPDDWLPEVRDRVARGLRLDAVDVARARHLRARLLRDLRAVFQEVDVLITPTLPCPAPQVDDGEVVVDGVGENVTAALTRFTNPWNLTGLPAGSVPAGRDADGGPIGVQVIGPWSGDGRVLGVMEVIEKHVGGPWPIVDAPPPDSAPERH